MTTYSELDQENKVDAVARVEKHWHFLYGIADAWAIRAYTYLMVTNSSGAIAMLSFLGASADARASFWVVLALAIFWVGVIFVGVITAILMFRSRRWLMDWKSASRRFYTDEEHFETLFSTPKAVKRDLLGYGLSWGSFACFLGGSFIGIWALLCILPADR